MAGQVIASETVDFIDIKEEAVEVDRLAHTKVRWQVPRARLRVLQTSALDMGNK